MFRRAADADSQHPRRTPARAHRGDLLDHPVDDIVAGIHHLELGLVLAAAALRRDVDRDRVAGHHLDREDAGRVVARVAAREGGIGEDRGAQFVVGVVVGAAHAFIDDVLQGAGRIEAAVLAPFDEHIDDAGVLADRAVPFGAHPAVGQDLRDRVLRRRALFRLVGIAQRADIIHRVVIADELQRVGDAVDQIVLADGHHRPFGSRLVVHRGIVPLRRLAGVPWRGKREWSKRLAPRGHALKENERCATVLFV